MILTVSMLFVLGIKHRHITALLVSCDVGGCRRSSQRIILFPKTFKQGLLAHRFENGPYVRPAVVVGRSVPSEPFGNALLLKAIKHCLLSKELKV